MLSGVAFLAALALVLFGSAGRWDLPMFWAYLAAWLPAVMIGPFIIDPTLTRERLRPGPGGTGYANNLVFFVLVLAQFVVAGRDVGRFHWSDGVPESLRLVGLLATAVAVAVSMWASAVNRFFSSVIRIQRDRGHRVITSGPYRFVRHPAYAAAPFLFIGTGLALGSWLAALIGVVLILPLLRRTAHEDRVLHEQLEGYAAYAHKVRYRLFPGIW